MCVCIPILSSSRNYVDVFLVLCYFNYFGYGWYGHNSKDHTIHQIYKEAWGERDAEGTKAIQWPTPGRRRNPLHRNGRDGRTNPPPLGPRSRLWHCHSLPLWKLHSGYGWFLSELLRLLFICTSAERRTWRGWKVRYLEIYKATFLPYTSFELRGGLEVGLPQGVLHCHEQGDRPRCSICKGRWALCGPKWQPLALCMAINKY